MACGAFDEALPLTLLIFDLNKGCNLILGHSRPAVKILLAINLYSESIYFTGLKTSVNQKRGMKELRKNFLVEGKKE